MKILSKRLKQGEVKLLIETPEDLWYLSQLIDAGDALSGKTPRKIKATEEADATKRMVFMAITVEKVDFSKTTNALRVSGKITDGPSDVAHGSYHTFALEPGFTITLVKPHWYSYQLDRLEEAATQKQPRILICVFDREEAYFALMKRTGAEILSHFFGEVERKRETVKIKRIFYEDIISQLASYDERFKLDYIILASPAFWKEDLLKHLKDERLSKKIIQATSSSVDERAIDEVLKREEVRTALQHARASKELILVEKLMAGIAQQGAVVYGLSPTEEAARAGAIDTLLITDTFIQRARAEHTFERIDAILKMVDKQNGAIIIISSEHDGGKKLNGIGGIAALLRYALVYH